MKRPFAWLYFKTRNNLVTFIIDSLLPLLVIITAYKESYGLLFAFHSQFSNSISIYLIFIVKCELAVDSF